MKSAYNSTQETGHTPSYKTPISVWQQVKKQLLSINRSDYMYIVYVWTNGAINLGQLNIISNTLLSQQWEDAHTNKFMLGQSVGRQSRILRQNADSLSV